MTRALISSLVATVTAMTVLGGGAVAQGPRDLRPIAAPPPAAPAPPAPQAIVVAPVPWERINISLSSSRTTYDVGHPISLRVSVSRDCYIYLFSTDASGVTRQLFPNLYDTDNFVRARRTYQIPDGNYRIVAAEPAGPDRLHLVATTEYYDWMDTRYRPQRSAEPFPLAPGGGRALADDLRREEQRSMQLGARPLVHHPPDAQPNARVEVRPAERPAWGERFLTLNIRRSSVSGPYPPSSWIGAPPEQPPPGQVIEAATVLVRTTPSGADITVNDVSYGRSPLELKLAPGQYDIVAERRGYLPEYTSIRVRPGTRQTVRLTLERD